MVGGIGAGIKRSGRWDGCWYKKELGVEGIGAGIKRSGE